MADLRTTEMKLIGLLAMLLALCVNPLVAASLLTADGQLDSIPLAAMLWVLTAVLALGGLALLRGNFSWPGKLAKAGLFLLCAGLTFYATVLADRLLGRFLPPTHSLIFPANTAVRYQTAEFDVTARINNLGFRDYDYPVNKGRNFRILVLGDSFTFGWGVALEDTWVKILETQLRAIHPHTEVLNLGRSGGSPETYAAIAARALPLLKPDLVLVGVLQGNDLYQCLPDSTLLLPARAPGAKKKLQLFLANAYPNFLRLTQKAVMQTETQPLWQEQAALIQEQLTPAQARRLEQIHPAARQAFRAGKLNPDLVYDFLRHPDMYLQLENTQGLAVQKAAEKLSLNLHRIKELATAHGASTWVVSVPNKYYGCTRSMQEHARLGLATDTALVYHNAPDSMLTAVAQGLQVPLFRTPELQARCRQEKLYYTYDSHFTVRGNQAFARALFRKVAVPFTQITRKQ